MSERARIRRYPQRAVPDQAANILARGLVAHVGFCQDGQPVVIPLSYHYDATEPDRLYLHGTHASRTLRHLASGAPVCIAVTLVEGLVYSRTAKSHSTNYRSAVCFGRARRVTGERDKAAILTRMIARYFPGRTAGRDYELPLPAHLRATAVLEVRIEEWSAKARQGGPTGVRDADLGAPGTAGVLDLAGDRHPRTNRGPRPAT